MKKLFLLASLVFSSAASASYLESCFFTATVTEVSYVATLNETVSGLSGIAKIKILYAKDNGSHFAEACTEIAKEQVQLLIKKGDEFKVRDLLEIDYFHANSPNPDDGFMMTETWKAKKIPWVITEPVLLPAN